MPAIGGVGEGWAPIPFESCILAIGVSGRLGVDCSCCCGSAGEWAGRAGGKTAAANGIVVEVVEVVAAIGAVEAAVVAAVVAAIAAEIVEASVYAAGLEPEVVE